MTVNELCPHCKQEVKLPEELGVYICPNCKKYIINCSQCNLPNCDECCGYKWKADYFNFMRMNNGNSKPKRN